MGLAAGFIITLISFAHIVYGEQQQIPALKKITDDPIIIGSLRIMIYQGGILLFAVGIIQVLVSMEIIQLPGISAYFSVGIVLINFVTSFVLMASIHREVFSVAIPQLVVFSIIIVLQLLSL